MQKYVIIGIFFFITIFSCEDNSNDKGDNDVISVLYPTNGSIIQDSIVISLEIQDETDILKVELWMNGDSTSIYNFTPPFSLELSTKNYDNGEHTFFIRLYTLGGEIFDSADINL